MLYPLVFLWQGYWTCVQEKVMCTSWWVLSYCYMLLWISLMRRCILEYFYIYWFLISCSFFFYIMKIICIYFSSFFSSINTKREMHYLEFRWVQFCERWRFEKVKIRKWRYNSTCGKLPSLCWIIMNWNEWIRKKIWKG
jgi:hypothetical protein